MTSIVSTINRRRTRTSKGKTVGIIVGRNLRAAARRDNLNLLDVLKLERTHALRPGTFALMMAGRDGSMTHLLMLQSALNMTSAEVWAGVAEAVRS